MASKKQRFIPNEIFRKLFEKETESAYLLVLFALATYGKDGKNIYPSIARIAHDTNYGERQIRRILKDLEDKKILEREKERLHRAITYSINIDALPDKKDFSEKQKAKAEKQKAKSKDSDIEKSMEIDNKSEGFDDAIPF